jgi:peptidoglycan/xylan/chitin deacetylase (PgdA/CDA1 family)
MIRNKREFLARQLGNLGLVRLLERAARRPSLLVATYHRIGRPAESPYFDAVFSATPEAFAAEVRFLRDRFRLITLDELLDLAGPDFPLTGPTALITFDDGYRDNLDEALPVLQALGVPATFFLVTGFLDAPRLPWWDHVSYVLKQARAAQITLDRPAPMTLDLEQTPRAEAIAAVVRAWLDHPPDRENEAEVRRHLEERAGVFVDEHALGSALFLTWDDARRLADAGMAIGSHSQSHPTLARLSEAEQFRELAGSKRLLEDRLGRPVEALAYPYGWPGATTDATRRLAREAGYRLAFSAVLGVNQPGRIDPFDLRRLNVGIADSPGLLRARMALYSSFGRSFL